MAGYYMGAERWKETRKNGKMKYIFFKTLILDFLIGLPFFIFIAPFIRNNLSFKFLPGYLKSGNIMRDIVIYVVAIFAIRIIFRYCTWNYNECKFKVKKQN